ncbi:hypothetical protein GEU84_004540 [Fertoebacter nigrum]|uniref:Uncharacterized protein n=1 Tax=Fertoeibacter niger TaxID=2656921 RepID=A0A8X8GSP9_9RHOB|nr:hypothetical protein [Fertoeibacter niger]NUB43644.1 hypothetical protein [Fertoeibacter niger]
MATHCHITTGLPVETLHKIHDCLALALDATESPAGYPQPMREARSYMRAALRQTNRLIGGAQ